MIELTYPQGLTVYTTPRGGRETNLGLLDQNIFFARWADEEIPAINESVCRLRSWSIMERIGKLLCSRWGVQLQRIVHRCSWAQRKKKQKRCRLSWFRCSDRGPHSVVKLNSTPEERELRKQRERMQGWLIIIVDHWQCVVFSSHWSYQEKARWFPILSPSNQEGNPSSDILF